ncbi:hypothetical protein SAMN05421890_1506 [Ensifer adhaerens]|nr:hypothetical protein SAMN05421890_1506 [Ensifer adhaerens]
MPISAKTAAALARMLALFVFKVDCTGSCHGLLLCFCDWEA